jgi:hypothetical protein
MAMPRTQNFIRDCQTQVTELLKVADAWAALKEEYAAMTTNNALPTQPDIDAVFGAGALTLAQFNQALAAQQAVVDNIHVPTTAAKLYRMRG